MWIESHQSLRNHPKIKKAARLAGICDAEMVGRLHYLWWWSLDYAPDGDITKYNSDDIEMAVDWSGTPGAFYNALLQCGFNGHCGLIETTDNHTVIHDWHDYGGRLLEKREANAERMRAKRASHVQDTTVARTGATEQNRTEQTEQNSTEDNNTPAKPDGINELQKLVLTTFGAKRFKNHTQAAHVAAWDRYPEQNVKAALTWAATKGFGLGQAIASLDKALPKWGATKSKGDNQHGTDQERPEPQYTPEFLAAAAEINRRRAERRAAQNG